MTNNAQLSRLQNIAKLLNSSLEKINQAIAKPADHQINAHLMNKTCHLLTAALLNVKIVQMVAEEGGDYAQIVIC